MRGSAGRYARGFQPLFTLARHRIGATTVWTGIVEAAGGYRTLVVLPGHPGEVFDISDDQQLAWANHLTACSIELAALGDGTINDLGEHYRQGLPLAWAQAALRALIEQQP